jgi:hypothetical protein
MFIYGHSLAANDDHILRAIVKSKIKQLFVGIYGDPELEDNKRIIKRAGQMTAERKKSPTLYVDFFDSESACVWK